MIKLNSAPSDPRSDSLDTDSLAKDSLATDSLAAELLDDASLETVLVMLEVIDCVEDLALLETLTPVQKRQVWDATPAATRLRLKQLRSSGAPVAPSLGLSPSVNRSHTTPLIEATDLLQAGLVQSDDEPPVEANQEETAAIDLEAQREEVDLMLREPLDLTAQPTVQIGDWVVLHAGPKLSKAEMLAIWEVIEMQGNYARIYTKQLGSRLYPMSGLAIYPKPVAAQDAAVRVAQSFGPATWDEQPDEESEEPEF